jgi:FMN phosphatase YigB (HAD superfamily)
MTHIDHIWFDLDGTLTIRTPEFEKAENKLRYEAYADATKRPLSVELFDEFERLYKAQGSNSAVFTSMGLPSNFWMQYYDRIDQSVYFKPVPKIKNTLKKLKELVPVSLFSDVPALSTLQTLEVIGIQKDWFTNILSLDEVLEERPALGGFKTIIEISKLRPDQILYIGDSINVDIKPPKQLGIVTGLMWAESSAADYSFKQFPDVLSLITAQI